MGRILDCEDNKKSEIRQYSHEWIFPNACLVKQRGLSESVRRNHQRTVIRRKVVFTKVCSALCTPQHDGKLKRQPFKK